MSDHKISDEISLKELVVKLRAITKYILGKWVIVVIVALICGIGGYFYAKSKDVLYVADISFSLDEEKSSGGGGLLGLASSFGLDMSGGGNLFTNENIIQLFNSKRIIYDALLSPASDNSMTHADLFLRIDNMLETEEQKVLLFPLGASRQHMDRLQDSILDILYKKIKKDHFTAIKPDKKVDIYHVVVSTPNENLSSSFSRAIVEQVSKLYTEIKTLKSKQTVDILQKRVDFLKGSFSRALYGRAAILDANLNPTFQSATVGASQKQAEITTSTAAYQELLKNLEMSKYSLLKQSPLFQIIDEPRFPLEKREPAGLIYTIGFAVLGLILTVLMLLSKRFLSTIR